jgi:copper chaperone CopZ
MKKSYKSSFWMLLVFIIVSTSLKAQISKAEIVATGLTCSMCSNAIIKQLSAMTYVDSVTADLNTSTFFVYLNKNNAIQPKLFKQRVERAGFFIGSLVLTMSFDNLKIDNNLIVKKELNTLIFVDTESKILKGQTKVKILDKGYVTQKEYKKMIKSFSKILSYAIENEEDYHIKVL